MPGASIIRVMYNTGRGDEHYLVLGEKELKGLQIPQHPGRPGTHDPKNILKYEAPPWEAQALNPKPVPREK
ncbi:hypothetical protein KY339_05475 [Candidatus Woesearchaeota archaeon]|nr:hypothetical protein [Candidatus Woesearchaeota archaeon]